MCLLPSLLNHNISRQKLKSRVRLVAARSVTDSPQVMRLIHILCTLVLALLPALTRADAQKPITVFAAASLGEAVKVAFEDYDAPLRLSLGGSGGIARQVAQGAPADLVILAHPSWMDWLAQQNAVRADTQASPFGNALVLVGPPGAAPLETLSEETIMQRLGDTGRLAMGQHQAVPAGQYAKAWLESQGLWETVAQRLAEVESVRVALALVARGEVPLAVVYRSDLVAAPDAATPVWIIPSANQPEILYAAAAVTDAGEAALAHLQSAGARQVFAGFGFVTDLP